MPRRSAALLLDPRFGPFLVGKLLSLTGIWIHSVAAAILVWDLTRDPTMVAAVAIAQFAPQFVVTPLAGAAADRASRGGQLALGRVFCVAGSGGLAVWMATPLSQAGGAWVVIACSGVLGIGFAVSGPAMQAMVPDLVEPEELRAAVALDGAPMMLGRAVGPAVGGLLMVQSGPAVTFAVATLGHVVFGLVALRLRRHERPRPSADDSGDGRARDAWGFLRAHPQVLLLLAGVATAGLGADPAVTLGPVIADRWSGSEVLTGYLAAAFGGGALVGVVVASLLTRRAASLALPSTGLTILAAGLVGVAVAPGPVTGCVGFLVAGVGFPVAISGCSAMVYAAVPDQMRGRVMSVWLLGFVGSRPLGAAVAGGVAQVGGVVPALLAVAAIVLLGAVSCSAPVLRRSARA